MSKTAAAKRKLATAARKLDEVRELLYQVGDLLPADRRIGLQDAVDALVKAQGRVDRAAETAGKTFEEIYPPTVETWEEKAERLNDERLRSFSVSTTVR